VLAQGATVVRVDPASSSAKVNDSVNLSVKVENISNLTAFELHLSFNASVLEVVSMTNGGFVAADFTAQNVFDNAAGTLDYAVAQMNRAPVQGSGALLNIVFRAKANGTATVAARTTQAAPGGILLSDQNGMAIQATWMDGSVNVGSGSVASPTPVKTTAPGATNTPAPTTAPAATSAPTKTGTTVTSTPAPTTTPVSSTTLGTHVVHLGEWLYCIGRAYKVSPWAIAETNGVWWPYIILPGQKLTIPNVAWTNMTSGPACQAQFTASASATPVPTAVPTSLSPAATATPTPLAACRATYVVRRGDTLYAIAAMYGSSYAEIARVNQIANPRLIYAGQQLCIP
jgi:LysM repeat protein